ncbi:unnamed protein product [Spirodela intermedia]|uniref:Uncharacterized protein n=1 Tax=Spirodela intermedia TaxID=51605 RepID=A0A7I8JCU0_SPIIN|nr:unnamed protein product [Spirodela intermedia]CAA6667960.1 unnamed protein product [Spirodela intermedia]
MQALRRWRVLLVLKPSDVYPPRAVRELEGQLSCPPSSPDLSRVVNPWILHYLDDRCRVHKETVNFCQDILQRRSLEWQPVIRNDLSRPIRGVDIVVTVGGDGTLLRASHFLDGDIPVLGVNSDPTQSKEVENFNNEFDARRSTGYLCAATAENFEQVLDEVLNGHCVPSSLSRISMSLNNHLLPTFALNDVLIAHPCPASVSRFSFRIMSRVEEASSLGHCRSSGFRVCTATGSTAAWPQQVVYGKRPIFPKDRGSMHGLIKAGETMQAMWYSKEGAIYVDGSHVVFPIQHGDALGISSEAPALRVYLPPNLSL